MNDRQTPLALYVHWPFCVSKCPYCDFNSHVRDNVDHATWEAALLADLRYEAGLAAGEPLDSIFFGGGTPSLMPPALVGRLLAEAEKPFIGPAVELGPRGQETLTFDRHRVEPPCRRIFVE